MTYRLSLVAILLALAFPADAACHRFSIWRFPWPQHCGAQHVAQREEPPQPPVKMTDDGVDIPLPSLKDMQFPKDCADDWCQRLKGIGLLRQKFGTN